MGRSYWFECSKCGYRAKVSGRADRGLGFHVQTIHCRDCKELYDAVTRLRVADESGDFGRLRSPGLITLKPRLTTPPSFQAALNRLLSKGIKRFRWLSFKLQCPVSPFHRVRSWTDPDKCPRCSVYLEKSALPYRLWD